MRQSLSGANKEQAEAIPMKVDKTDFLKAAVKNTTIAKKPKAAEPWIYKLKWLGIYINV